MQGDLGTSLYSEKPITEEIAERLPVTFSLALITLLFAIPLALLFGVLGGLRPNGIFDRGLLVGTSLAIAMPSFWVALLLVTVFAVQLHWLPPFGYVPFGESPVEWFRHLILPATALALTTLAVLSRQLRAGLSDTMNSAFVRTGMGQGRQHATGRRRPRARRRRPSRPSPCWAFRSAASSAVPSSSSRSSALPGLGTYLLGAVEKRDIPVILATALLLVVINMLASLAVDITYGYLNPKVRDDMSRSQRNPGQIRRTWATLPPEPAGDDRR